MDPCSLSQLVLFTGESPNVPGAWWCSVNIHQMNLMNEGTQDVVTGFDSRCVSLWSPYILQAEELIGPFVCIRARTYLSVWG